MVASISVPAPAGNAFLDGLRGDDFALIRPHLSRKELRAGENLACCGDPIDEVVFPHSGLIIMTAPLHDQGGAAVALIARDAFAGGLPAAASLPAHCDSEVLISGHASAMSATAFRHVLNQSSSLRHAVAQFNHAMMAQAQQTALCNAAHSVEARLCRWLLDVCDRSGDSRIPFTQGMWARLLAVRRTTVTLMAGRLEAAGALDCRRGCMRIVDRSALEQHCCGCYGQLKSLATRPIREPSNRGVVERGGLAGQAPQPIMTSRMA